MKNLHLIATDKPSRLRYNASNVLVLTGESYRDYGKLDNQHIYITSDEISGFENNIWVILGTRIWLWQSNMALVSNNKPKKIILTTDQDLIKDGIQSIDDEFLEWFVNNPSCESVEVDKNWNYPLDNRWEYKIRIPQEEPKTGYVKSETEFSGVEFTLKDGSKQFVPKQETLEEAAERLYPTDPGVPIENLNKLQLIKHLNNARKKGGFIEGANWQAERMYSDSIQFGTWLLSQDITSRGEGVYVDDKSNLLTVKDLFEQFKKK
jgi:hypothetical protein